MEINIKLTVEEINLLLKIIGQLPNSSGTYFLLAKIKEQGEAQVVKAENSSTTN